MWLDKIQNWLGPLVLGLALSFSFTSEAASLDLLQAYPSIQASDLEVHYNAASGELTAGSTLFSWLTYDTGSLATSVSSADYQLSVMLDSAGTLQSGTFSISGGISELGIAPGSSLISGNVIAFGFTDGDVDLFDFVVGNLSGALAADYGTALGINMVTYVGGGFGGTFTADFAASAMSDNFATDPSFADGLSSVPLPGAIWLFASGLVAMMGGLRLKKQA